MRRRRINPNGGSEPGARARKVYLNVNQRKDNSFARCLALKREKSLLCKELKETQDNLERQKNLTEASINREKETRQMLEKLQKYSDPKTLTPYPGPVDRKGQPSQSQKHPCIPLSVQQMITS